MFAFNFYSSARFQVRETNRKASVHEYFRMKLQWKSLSEDQENRFDCDPFVCLVFSKQTLYRVDGRISAGLPPFAKEKPRLKRTWAERIGVIPTLWGTIIPMSIFSRSVLLLLDPAHFWCQILINHIGTCSLLDSCRLAVLLINWFSNLLIKEF